MRELPRLTVRIDDATLQRLARYRERNGSTAQWIVNEALRRFLEQAESGRGP